MFRALETPHSRQARLVVHGQSLYHPAWLVHVGKEERISPEDRLSKSPDPARSIEVEDVCELVSDDESVPVSVVAEARRVGGRVREQHDAIRGKRRRVAV